ncbi:MAG: uncharacterized protein H6R18_734 [Proteobacteria bacterium]|nr:uncharacterized protein [Pseudomonadota bacterium]
MVNSVNTNTGAMAALQSLNNSKYDLSSTAKTSQGLRIAGSSGAGTAFAVAQSLQRTSSALSMDNQSLASAKGAVDTASAATEKVSESLQSVRKVVTQLSDASLDSSKRTELQTQYKSLVSDIGKTIDSASVNGVNALGGDKQKVTANVRGDTLEFGGADLKAKLAMPTEMNSAAAAQAFLGQTSSTNSAVASQDSGVKLADMEKVLGNVKNDLGTSSRRIGAQISFNNAMQESMNTSLGAIVDADLSMESANLQALQVRQQLGAQSLSIANQAPQSLLSLFR